MSLSIYHTHTHSLGRMSERGEVTETRDTNNFPQGNHKGENSVTSSEIESTPKVKPKNIKMISRQQQSLSLIAVTAPLTHAPQ